MLNFRKIIALILPNFQKSKTLKTFIVKNKWNKKFVFTKINKKKFVYNNWQFILLIGYIKKENDLKHEISMISFTYKYKKKKKRKRDKMKDENTSDTHEQHDRRFVGWPIHEMHTGHMGNTWLVQTQSLIEKRAASTRAVQCSLCASRLLSSKPHCRQSMIREGEGEMEGEGG